MLKGMKICFNCGSPVTFKNRKIVHTCRWTSYKSLARCKDPQCNKGAALCKEHDDNATDELKSWLGKMNMKFSVGVVTVNTSKLENEFTEDFKEFCDKYSGPPNPDICSIHIKQVESL